MIFTSDPDTAPARSAYGNSLLWNGRRYDSESCLYYYRTRYLEPETGQFTTRDTIGLWGDPVNLGNGRTYTANNPWSWVDPFGLASGCGADSSIDGDPHCDLPLIDICETDPTTPGCPPRDEQGPPRPPMWDCSTFPEMCDQYLMNPPCHPTLLKSKDTQIAEMKAWGAKLSRTMWKLEDALRAFFMENGSSQKDAIEYARNYVNAVRHCVMQCLIALECGDWLAEYIGNEYEEKHPGTPLDTAQDLHNNKIGRRLAKGYRKPYPEDCFTGCQAAAIAEFLIAMDSRAPGTPGRPTPPSFPPPVAPPIPAGSPQ